jgi:type IV secretory pathway TrbD component
MFYIATHEEITQSLAALKGVTIPEANALTGETLLSAALRAVRIYRALMPAVLALSVTPFFPASVRAGFTLLAQGMELLATAVTAAASSLPSAPSPVIAAAAADTTTTDPTSTDPSFKAGKDL